ncbi:MAG: hypothetical protein IT373_23810 [Polyangiaceae bacterium]|nr:hypothetical protein [Polyangiaceae bacterium]
MSVSAKREPLLYEVRPADGDRELVAFGRFRAALRQEQRGLLAASILELWKASGRSNAHGLFLSVFCATLGRRRHLERLLPRGMEPSQLRLPQLDGFFFRHHCMLSVSVDDRMTLDAAIDAWWFDLMVHDSRLIFWAHSDGNDSNTASSNELAELWATCHRTGKPPRALLSACAMFAKTFYDGAFVEVWQPREADLVVSALERAAGAQRVDVEEVVDQF